MDSLQVDSSPSKELSRKVSLILRLQKICFSVRGLGNLMYVGSIYRNGRKFRHMNKPLWRSIEA